MIKALALLRHPLAYSAADRIIDLFKLNSFDPIFVNEAARGFSVLAEGKGKGKRNASHLTAKVGSRESMSNFSDENSYCLPRSSGTHFCPD